MSNCLELTQKAHVVLHENKQPVLKSLDTVNKSGPACTLIWWDQQAGLLYIFNCIKRTPGPCYG